MNTTAEKTLKEKIREIPDWPQKGVIFRDITTVLKDPEAFKLAIDSLYSIISGRDFDAFAAVESRGFIFGSVLAHKMGKAFIPVRKQGKLPAKTISQTYDLEYGTDTLTMHEDAVTPGMKVILVDDLIATGGSASAVAKMIEKLEGKVEACLFLIELTDLAGRENLKDYEVLSVIKY